LIYIALPIAATIDLLPEIARHAPPHALVVTDACSTKVRISQAARRTFFLAKRAALPCGHPWPEGNSRESRTLMPISSGKNTYALIGASSLQRRSRISALVKILEKIGARPLWLGAPQHD